MRSPANPGLSVCLDLTRAISRARTVEEIYASALDALEAGLGVSRASILLFDTDEVMRFTAWRGLSDSYRQAVEGHTPWRPDSVDAEPIAVSDVCAEPSLASLVPVFRSEQIAALAFIPLVSLGRVIGKFMLYYAAPHALARDEVDLARVIAAQVAFAVERTRAEAHARRSEERLRFALDAASMGTWDWDLTTSQVRWSDNLERLHGLPAGTFDGTFASYEREIHPEDRERVLASARRAFAEGVPHEVEYRIVAPDGAVRWVEGTGHVEYEDGRPVRMTGVCMMVTRRKEAELARLAAAEEANRLKDEFLAILSHELRTPLNAILGWVQMLQTGSLSPERARDAVAVIGRNAKLQAQLIEDILDVSRIISGKLEIDRQPVLVPHLVETVVSGALPAAQARHLEIAVDVPPGLPPIEGDPKRLHQVLGNVLSNAIKFTPDGGRIAVSCRIAGDDVELAVRDTGVGIGQDFLPFVFERFRQADGRATRRHGGLGLGLAIARHLVEQHGGSIVADSAGVGQGTTVTMRVPAGSLGRDVPPVPQTRLHEPQVELRMEGSRVLVVDDERDSRELLGALFERCGAEVVACDRAEAALEVLDRADVHLIVADIAMPDVDGCELVRRVRRAHGAVPAVAVSAHARAEDRDRALASGFNAYCPKPVETTGFLQTVRDAMRGK